MGQFVGGIVGALVIFIIASATRVASATATNLGTFSAKTTGFASNGFGIHSPGGFPLSVVILAEIFFTAVFVFVIASTSRKSMPVGQTGLTVGLTLTVIHLISIPIDNTSVNPARSLATAVFQGSWALNQLWVFIVFPVVGGILGAGVWRALRPESDEGTEEESEAGGPGAVRAARVAARRVLRASHLGRSVTP